MVIGRSIHRIDMEVPEGTCTGKFTGVRYLTTHMPRTKKSAARKKPGKKPGRKPGRKSTMELKLQVKMTKKQMDMVRKASRASTEGTAASWVRPLVVKEAESRLKRWAR